MLVTYAVIALTWVICINGIEWNLNKAITIFIVAFAIYIVVIGVMWAFGITKRDELRQEYIENKLKEQKN